MKNKPIVVWLLGVFFIWRLSLFLINLIGSSLISFPEGDFIGEPLAYLRGSLLLYPLLSDLFTSIVDNYVWTGLFVSHLSLLVALFLLYRLVLLDFDEKVAKRSLIYLLIFPTAFYFGSACSESLFLALVLGSFYAARKKLWWVAGLLGALASTTHLVGIFLFPALGVEWLSQLEGLKRKEMKNILPLFLIILGLLVFVWGLKITTGDPLYFIHVQPHFGIQKAGGKIILLYQVFWRYLKMLITVEKFTPTYFVVVLEAFTGVGFFFLTVFAYLRRWFSYLTFMVLAYVVPTLTGTFSSMPRYALALFPGFILLAIWSMKYRWVRVLYPAVSIPLLIVAWLLFNRGYFIA